MTTKMELELDELDHKAVIEALAWRERQSPLPNGKGNIEGRTIAEICRGWKDYVVWSSDNIASEAQQLEADWAEEAGFDMLSLKNEINRRLATIKGIEIIGSGCGADSADISFELEGHRYALRIVKKGD